MEPKTYKIKTATYATTWMYIATLLILIAVFIATTHITNRIMQIKIIGGAAIVGAALYFSTYFSSIRHHVFALDNGMFKFQNLKGKAKWQVPVEDIVRIDEEPYVLNSTFFIRAFTYTTADKKTKFVNFLPFDYEQMVTDLLSLNPNIEVRTDYKARTA